MAMTTLTIKATFELDNEIYFYNQKRLSPQQLKQFISNYLIHNGIVIGGTLDGIKTNDVEIIEDN